MQRETGYYFVKVNGKDFIGLWNGSKWALPTIKSQLDDYNLEYISPTPITPEKIQALDEIVQAWANGVPRDAGDIIFDIITKHGLL